VNRESSVGSTVVVQNSRSTQAPARVVTLVSAIQGVYAYGVEFLEDVPVKDFWVSISRYQRLSEVEEFHNLRSLHSSDRRMFRQLSYGSRRLLPD
jgi:hypothetical protein